MLRGGRWYSFLTAIVLIVPYTVYSWMIFPVVFVSLLRQVAGRTSWAKTERESIGTEPDHTVGAAAEKAPDGVLAGAARG